MDRYTCPKGHQSTEADFCSQCGAKIAIAPPAPPVAEGKETCPECFAEHARDSGNFCEVCGHDFTKGAGSVNPSASRIAAGKGWMAIVSVDPSLREPDSPEPPAGVEPFTVELDKPVNLIGRRSQSRAVFPEISLNFDVAVSHRHALLELADGGALLLRDIGAANGTRLNGKDVKPLVDVRLQDGDEITVGHWTRIRVKAVD